MSKLSILLLSFIYFGIFCFLIAVFCSNNELIAYNKSTLTYPPEIDVLQVPALQTICHPGRTSDCVPPFQNMPSKFRVAPSYSLGACVIEKSMSTVMAAVMCMLFNVKKFKQNNRTLHKEVWNKRFCKGRNEYESVRDMKNVVHNGTYIAVVRHPIQRFLSGFTDKCIKNTSHCYNCRGNLTCFINKQYRRMLDRSVGKRGISFEDIHFNPQNWYCGFRDNLVNYEIIHYGSTGEENLRMSNHIGNILANNEVEENVIKEIIKEISAEKTPHATLLSRERIAVERELYSNKQLLSILVKMFYYDFVIFGFPLPII